MRGGPGQRIPAQIGFTVVSGLNIAERETGVRQVENRHPSCGAILAGVLALPLVACGGGGSGGHPGAPPTDPSEASAKGRWSEVIDWPLIPIHVVLLPDGRVFSFGSDDGSPAGGAVPTGKFFYDLWNPADRQHLVLPNSTAVDTFCAAQLVLPQPGAGVLVVGGDTFPRPLEPEPSDPLVPEPFDDGNPSSTVLDYTMSEPALRKGQDMAAGRWYATATTLLNGETYVQGGNSRSLTSGELFPEVRSTAGDFRQLAIDTSDLRYYYPRNFVVPGGRLFGYDTEGRMYFVDPQAQTLTRLGELPAANTGDDSTVAMFSPGRLLHFAGESDGAIVIDVSRGDPVVTPTGRLSSHRRLATATLLPNGQVLATGGSPVYNTLPGVNYFAEMWDPVSGEWTLGAEGFVPRLYHSTALLLPDATVLVAGGGAPGPADNLNAEIYAPPYLFDSSGALARRPVINAVPDTLVVGRQFLLGYSDLDGPATRVVLIKTGAQTHGLNMEQRFVELTFRAGTGCGSPSCLAVHMPSEPADVPPGYYLLFVLNADGVPSRGRFVFINVAAAPDPMQDPVLARPDDRDGAVGATVSLVIAGSDPNAGTRLRYAAAGLPAGLSIDARTGVIGGRPEAAGHYNVVVSVSDDTPVSGEPEQGARTASTGFVWRVTAASP